MSILGEHDVFLLLPEIYTGMVAISLLMYGVFFSNNKNLLMSNITWLCSLCILLTAILVLNSPIDNALLYFNSIILDELTSFSKLLVLFGSLTCFLMSIRYFQNEINSYEYAILMLLATSSMLLMICSYDLIALYLTIELQSLAFYVLASSKRDSEFSTESGLKYFLLGAFSSGILLFACSIIYGTTGTTSFYNLSLLFTGFSVDLFNDKAMLLGVLFLAIGFLFKLTAAPFHMWAPDVYEGAPTAITAFFSIVPKIAFLSVFIRFFVISLHEFPWQDAIMICSILSMIVGSLAALSQNKIKRVLAFSTVGHIGYMLMGTCCQTMEGLQSILIYMVLYVVMTVSVFSFLLSLRNSNGVSVKYIEDLSILSTTNPTLAITFAICLFSMAGVPPLAGFCSKFYLFFAALGSGLYVLAIVGVATSCISCFYYIRLIKIMYFEKPKDWIEFEIMDKQKAIILAITLFVILAFFLYPAPLFFLTHKIALILTY